MQDTNPTLEAPETTSPESHDDPKPKPPARDAEAQDQTDWKAEARKWEARAKENSQAAARLAEIEDANKTEAQRAAERLADAERRAAEADARALRRDIALDPLGDGKHILSRSDAALLDAVTDEDDMRALAARLASPTVAPASGNSAPLEGEPPKQAPGDERYSFVEDLVARART